MGRAEAMAPTDAFEEDGARGWQAARAWPWNRTATKAGVARGENVSSLVAMAASMVMKAAREASGPSLSAVVMKAAREASGASLSAMMGMAATAEVQAGAVGLGG